MSGTDHFLFMSVKDCEWEVSNTEILVKLILPYKDPTVKKLEKLWDVSMSLPIYYSNHIKWLL